MSSPRVPDPPRLSRNQLLGALAQAAERSATDGILFHQAIADRLKLHITDLRCLNALIQAGPSSAGELAKQVSLTTGAVTRMLDRLERAGFIRREHDRQDRRRVMIHPVPKALAGLEVHYRGIAQAWSELLGSYTDEQLVLFLELFERMHALTQTQLTLAVQRRPREGSPR